MRSLQLCFAQASPPSHGTPLSPPSPPSLLRSLLPSQLVQPRSSGPPSFVSVSVSLTPHAQGGGRGTHEQ